VANKMNKKQNGFTLLEILVVIALLGILATIIMGSYLASLKKARDSRRKQDLEQISRALELYYSQNNSYPEDIDVDFGGPLENPNGGDYYMKMLPQDPSGATSGYNYDYISNDGQEYQLYSCLENDQDPDYSSYTGSENCGTSCDGMCHYGIASPNSEP